MKTVQLSKKVRIGILTLLIPSAIWTFAQLAPSVYGRLTAPQFSALTYTYTNYSKETMCLLTCRYTPYYHYSASGSQKDIAESVINKLKTMGFSIQNQPDNTGNYKADIRCYGGGPHSSGDQYFFENPTGKSYVAYWDNQRHEITEGAIVTFYPKSELKEVNTNEVGCQRPSASYRVEIVLLDRQVYGL